MTKKKSFLMWVLAICLMVPTMLLCTACKKGGNGEGEQPPHTHTFSSEWSHDDANHWHPATCEHTTERASEAAHVYDNLDDATCNECGYVRVLSNRLGLDIKPRVYNGKAQPVQADEYTITNVAGGVTIEYKAKDADDSAYSQTAPKNAGEYSVRISVEGNETYTGATIEGFLYIEQYTLNEVTTKMNSKVYDGNSNVVVYPDVFEGDIINVQIVMTSKNVGATPYQAVVNGPAGNNYKLPAISEIRAEITAKKLNFDTTNMTKEYDGTANYRYDFTTADGLVAGDECYVAFAASTRTTAASSEECINAGTYNSVVTNDEIKASNHNYEIDTAYSKFGSLSEGEGTKLTITKIKLSNFSYTITLGSDETGSKTKILEIPDSKLAQADKVAGVKLHVKITYNAQSLSIAHALGLTTGIPSQSQAKIEFDIDEGTDAHYANYEFATENLGSITLG